MMIYALGDLHLSGSGEKPMDVFGEAWVNHQENIQKNWERIVGDEDIVLIPGDISWAMTLAEAAPDLEFIGSLPGTKVMIRGNHDYWWSGIGKVRSCLPKRVYAIQNDSVAFSDFVVCGTRGWLLPGHPSFGEDDARLLNREAERLRMSLEHANRTGLPKICMIHYPPLGQSGEDTVFSRLMEEYKVELCVYGHLHGNTHRFRYDAMKDDVRYVLTSADYAGFKPIPLPLSHEAHF